MKSQHVHKVAPVRPRIRLSSLPVAVLLMALVVLLMLTGVFPARGGHQDTVFRTPVFALLLALLGISTAGCCIRRKLKLRAIGYYLVHVSVLVIMLGALLGVAFEKKVSVKLQRGDTTPVQLIAQPDGSQIDLGFGLSLESFRVVKYPPHLLVYRDGELQGAHRIVSGGTIDVGAAGTVHVEHLLPRAAVTNVLLAGNPELIISDSRSNIWKRVRMDSGEREIPLPNGDLLLIVRVYNNLPTMEMGHVFHETDYPSRPGLILRILSSNRVAVIALPAGEAPIRLTPSEESLAPEIPDMVYTFPRIKDIAIVPSDSPTAPYAVELSDAEGKHRVLVGHGGRLGSCLLSHGYALKLDSAADRSYEAMLSIRHGGTTSTQRLAINEPVNIDSWRIYLDDYDPHGHHFITVTVRHDPGDPLVVAGIIGLMLGTAILFYIRKRTP